MKKTIDRKRVILYLWIGLIWLVLWFFSILFNFPEEFYPRILNETWRHIYILSLNFILFEYVWPFIKLKRKTIVYNILIGLVLVFLMMMLLSFGIYGWRHLGIQIGIYTPFRVNEPVDHGVSYQTSFSVMSVVFYGLIVHFYDYRQLIKTTQQLKIEKQEAELSYLKSQTNPHFLFNTLNNIYSLARDKSDLAPESIMRLSKMLRFMLYETGGDYISIEQELKIISDYIELEKLRYDDSLQVNFNYDIEDLKQAIPPLLLIPLVENAFKHGVSESRSNPFVNIHLAVRQRQLTFVVKNSAEEVNETGEIKENIGLSNLGRQLELLYKDYNLSVLHKDAVFTADLKINLASHV